MSVKVKVCGITNVEDALAAVEAGADALGFIFSSSPRQVEVAQAQLIIQKLPPFITTVGVFADEPAEKVMRVLMSCHLDAVQLHGEEHPSYSHYFFPLPVIKAFLMKDEKTIKKMKRYTAARAFLLDAYHIQKRGGTGKTFNWDWAIKAKALGKPIILSGGLGPDNVEEAIKKVKPYAVDASSKLEKSPGKKDHKKIYDYITRAKNAGAEI